MFKDLKGIEKGREEKERDEGKKFKLLTKIKNQMIKKYIDPKYWGGEGQLNDQIYPSMYAELESKILRDVELTKGDIINYVMQNLNDKALADAWINYIHGMYTGCLLELLTRRNQKQNKRTQIYLNGMGKTFFGLFYNARQVDELILENFSGTYAGMNIASEEGSKANTLIALNMRCFNVFQQAGNNRGEIGLIIMKDIDGNSTGKYIGTARIYPEKQNIELVIGMNLTGEWALKQANADTIIAKNIKGLLALNNARGARLISAQDLYREHIDDNAIIADFGSAEHSTLRNAYSKKLLYDNVQDKYAYYTPTGEIICRKKSPEEYEKNMKEYKIRELIELAESLEDKSPGKMFETAQKIKETYDSVKEKIE